MTDIQVVCNMCGSTEFGPFAGRPVAQCKKCWSLERTRAMMHLIQKHGLIESGMRVLHFAPERGIGLKLIEIVGADHYDAYDLFPEIFHESLNVQKFDLTQAFLLPTENYDLILHSHILEHIPCYVAVVLWHLQRSLKQNGTHLFCMPVMAGNHESDFNPLSEESRLQRFGQKDHVRRFGSADIDKTIGQVFCLNSRNSNLGIDAKLAAAHNIGAAELQRTFFMMQKDDLLLSEKFA